MNQTQLVQHVRTVLPRQSGKTDIGHVQIAQTEGGKSIIWWRPSKAKLSSQARNGFRKSISLMNRQTAQRALRNILQTNKIQPITKEDRVGLSILLQDIPIAKQQKQT